MKTIRLLALGIIIPVFFSCASNHIDKPKTDYATTTSYTKTEIINSPPENVFPLFCPVKEYDWLRKWSCTMNYSNSGFAEKNAIFQSSYSFPFGLKATWICTRYEPNKAITYTVFIPNTFILVVENEMEKTLNDQTMHKVVYTAFGLNWLGKRMVKQIIEKDSLKKSTESLSTDAVYFLKYNKKISD
jgi:hypothetical protein